MQLSSYIQHTKCTTLRLSGKIHTEIGFRWSKIRFEAYGKMNTRPSQIPLAAAAAMDSPLPRLCSRKKQNDYWNGDGILSGGS
jgi:hypothetical protein